MRKVGIITFHASHNYGSMLQNYALQQAILQHCHGWMPVTINMRSERQKEQYDWFKPFFKLIDKKRFLLSLLFAPWKKDLQYKRFLFEDFLQSKINLSQELSELTPENNPFDFDAYISGSDQIWNIKAMDFSWNYFLDFVNNSSKKIAYAVSMGTTPGALHDAFVSHGGDSLRRLIEDYDFISVREAQTANEIRTLTNGSVNPEVICDPTMLLNPDEWLNIIQPERIVGTDKYIFLYNPYYIKDVYTQAEILSSKIKMPLIISNLNVKTILFHSGLRKELKTGPLEFLNLVKNASYVIGRSFHLAVFGTLLKRPFFAVNAAGDSRLHNFLTRMHLMDADTHGDILDSIGRVSNLNFERAHAVLAEERQAGLDFLKSSLQ